MEGVSLAEAVSRDLSRRCIWMYSKWEYGREQGVIVIRERLREERADKTTETDREVGW